jgi:hypothetical protein
MPTILRVQGFRIMIFPNDHAPAHVHVFKGGATFQVDLKTFTTSNEKGNLSDRDLKLAKLLVRKHSEILREEWERIHGE